MIGPLCHVTVSIWSYLILLEIEDTSIVVHVVRLRNLTIVDINTV